MRGQFCDINLYCVVFHMLWMNRNISVSENMNRSKAVVVYSSGRGRIRARLAQVAH